MRAPKDAESGMLAMDNHLPNWCAYEFELINKARRVMHATRLKRILDSERLLDLAKKIDFAATFPGSIIDGLIPFADDREEFEELRKKLIFAQSHFPEIAGEIEEDLESKRCRVRTRALSKLPDHPNICS